MKESEIEGILRSYLLERGWILNNSQKSAGQHGCDIVARHPKWSKMLFVEVKGEGKAEAQTMHNAFWTLFGQILSRMDKEGNNPKKARIYAIAIPANWENTFKNKIKNMTFGWKLLKLKVFLVKSGEVKERSYSYFL